MIDQERANKQDTAMADMIVAGTSGKRNMLSVQNLERIGKSINRCHEKELGTSKIATRNG